jgi:hypothetical protein
MPKPQVSGLDTRPTSSTLDPKAVIPRGRFLDISESHFLGIPEVRSADVREAGSPKFSCQRPVVPHPQVVTASEPRPKHGPQATRTPLTTQIGVLHELNGWPLITRSQILADQYLQIGHDAAKDAAGF